MQLPNKIRHYLFRCPLSVAHGDASTNPIMKNTEPPIEHHDFQTTKGNIIDDTQI